ncbi:MAG: PfkB family carbohydrate kinase [Ilumatobacteraceae bacterium]
MTDTPPAAVLVGPASVDRYLDDDGTLRIELPGGGALNMAHHWSVSGVPALFVTRIGDDREQLFRDFLRRHGIAHLPELLVAPGASASIDIRTRADRQPAMDNFVEGVWGGFALHDAERAAVSASQRLHLVLVEPVIAELERLGDAGSLDGVEVSADFLSFVHYDVDRFARTMRHVDLGFVGWPGARDDATVVGIRDAVWRLGKLAVVTMGARGVLVIDGRDGRSTERWMPVDAVEVLGTTVGCGDAFIAAFLGEWWAGHGLDAAVDAGRAAGAAATAWQRPLPDGAYAISGE